MDTTLRTGPRRKHRALEFWAEEGLIQVEDQNDGECVCYTQEEFKNYFKEIGKIYEDKIDKWSTNDKYFVDMRNEYRNLLLNVEECLKEAKAHGDPTEYFTAEKKRQADLLTQLSAVNPRLGNPMVTHNGRASGVFNPMDDPRARRTPQGGLWLPHGGGAKVVRRHFS